MTCEILRFPGGGAGFVCSRGRRPATPPKCEIPGCGKRGARQCDFPIADSETCDKYLCSDHAVPQGRGRDHCPDHHTDLFSAAGLVLGVARRIPHA